MSWTWLLAFCTVFFSSSCSELPTQLLQLAEAQILRFGSIPVFLTTGASKSTGGMTRISKDVWSVEDTSEWSTITVLESKWEPKSEPSSPSLVKGVKLSQKTPWMDECVACGMWCVRVVGVCVCAWCCVLCVLRCVTVSMYFDTFLKR